MRITAAIAVLILAATFAVAQTPVPREFRAAWIATVDNIDFPTRRGLSADAQRRELTAILDLAADLRLNALVFQVRPMADAVYRPGLEPWSEFLTGEMGRPQAFDPLAFLVEEAHKRGILVHAWFNPYRAGHPASRTMSATHVSRTKPDIVRKYGRYLWLDPTDPRSREHSLAVIRDVVRRYDIDGVHFDDYFYPYAERDAAGKNIDFPDDANWLAYVAAGGKLSRGDWRRSNVNLFIESVGREIKRIKPHVLYGISPFGIWQPQPDKGIAGFNAFAELYADSRKWLRDGTADYIAPQLYWETSRVGLSFPKLLAWWRSENVRGRHIWPGIAAYRIGSTATFTASEIASQIRDVRRDASSPGEVFFSFKSLRNDLGGIRRTLRDEVYSSDALVPATPWIKTRPPAPPRVSIVRTLGLVRVNWTPGRGTPPFRYVVHALDAKGWSHSILPAAARSISLSASRNIRRVIVRSVDRLGNQSR